MGRVLVTAFACLGFVLPAGAFAASIKMICIRADEQKKPPCYRVVHVLSEEAAKAKESQGCIRDTGKKAASSVSNTTGKDGVSGAR